MFELDENGTQWTDEARTSFRAAAEGLVEAIRRHSAALLEMTGTDADAEAIADAGEQLEAAATAYADMQFEFTGTVPPLGLDEEDDYSYDEADYDDSDYDDSDDDLSDHDLSDDDLSDHDLSDHGETDEADEFADGELAEAGEPAARLTVLHRIDFVVTDELAVIQAGKEAYHDSVASAEDGEDGAELPDDGEQDREELLDVTELSDALQQIQQAGGIEALADTPGMVSAGATTWVLEATELLDERDPDEWPEFPFALGEDAAERLLHRLDEVAG